MGSHNNLDHIAVIKMHIHFSSIVYNLLAKYNQKEDWGVIWTFCNCQMTQIGDQGFPVADVMCCYTEYLFIYLHTPTQNSFWKKPSKSEL
jgi:hypothetical protein